MSTDKKAVMRPNRRNLPANLKLEKLNKSLTAHGQVKANFYVDAKIYKKLRHKAVDRGQTLSDVFRDMCVRYVNE